MPDIVTPVRSALVYCISFPPSVWLSSCAGTDDVKDSKVKKNWSRGLFRLWTIQILNGETRVEIKNEAGSTKMRSSRM